MTLFLINVDVIEGALHKLRFGAHEGEHGAGEAHGERRNYQAEHGRNDERGVADAALTLLVGGAYALGHDGVYARAETDEKAREERDVYRGRAHSAERAFGPEFADDGHVRHVEQHLQHVRQHERQRKNKNIFKKRTARHGERFFCAQFIHTPSLPKQTI